MKRPQHEPGQVPLSWRNVDAVPLVHGRLPFALLVREQMLAQRYSALAVELPPSLRSQVLDGVRRLPCIHAVVYRESTFLAPIESYDPAKEFAESSEADPTAGGEVGRAWYVVLDPCDGMIEALRIAIRERTSIHFIDAEVEDFQDRRTHLPDPHAALTLGLSKFYDTLLPALRAREATKQDLVRERHMALRLAELSRRVGEQGRILFVTGMAHWERIRLLLERGGGALHGGEGPDEDWVELVPMAEEALTYGLGELPFSTWQYERHRAGISLERHDPILAVKELLVHAREHHERLDHGTLERATPAAMARTLDYLRRLTLSQQRLSPGLYGLVVAAKGVIGARFALAALEVARSYPPNRRPGADWDYERHGGTTSAPGSASPEIAPKPVRDAGKPLSPFASLADETFQVADFESAGREAGELDLLGGHGVLHDQVSAMTSRAPGEERELKHVFLEARPPAPDRERWRTAWNPHQQCSWPPEDLVIENLRSYVSHRALSMAGIDRVRSEEFTTSLKDGLDLRETLRNLPLGKIYVREEPRVPGRVGAVVLVFEEDDAGTRFPWRTTWLAEHGEESTLAFYATDFTRDLVGPGIARARYGGCMMIYPPIVVRDVWEDLRFERARTPSERLLLAALVYSKERFVSHVSERPPSPQAHATAARLGKHIVHLPLSSFSSRLLERIRTVHVLNGQHVRSWAARFVR